MHFPYSSPHICGEHPSLGGYGELPPPPPQGRVFPRGSADWPEQKVVLGALPCR